MMYQITVGESVFVCVQRSNARVVLHLWIMINWCVEFRFRLRNEWMRRSLELETNKRCRKSGYLTHQDFLLIWNRFDDEKARLSAIMVIYSIEFGSCIETCNEWLFKQYHFNSIKSLLISIKFITWSIFFKQWTEALSICMFALVIFFSTIQSHIKIRSWNTSDFIKPWMSCGVKFFFL